MNTNKKIIVINPHVNNGFFGRSVYNSLTRRKNYKKYQYLIQAFIDSKNIDIEFYFDGRDSSMPFKFPLYLEIAFWYLINLLNPLKIKPIFNIVNKSADVTFLFAHRNLDKDSGIDLVNEIKKTSSSCIVHMTHFHADIEKTAKNIKILKPEILCAESDLPAHSGLFNKYFKSFNSSFLVIPFVPQDRFQFNKDFNQRKNKAMITGTIHPYDGLSRHKAFCEFYKTKFLHPMRVELFNNSYKFNNEIDSYVSKWLDVEKINTSNKNISFFSKLYAKYSNHFLAKQSNYFKFNMVDTFNSYKMFIAPSEITGLTVVAMSEGMMCGTVYIGSIKEPHMNGMIDKHNFIGYDGSKEDLIEKIKYYQKNPNLLENIAINGYEYAKKEFNKKNVSKKFIDTILNI